MTKETKKAPRHLKYAWAALLSLAVGALALTDKESPLLPLLNQLIDVMQEQQRGQPSPAAGAARMLFR